MNRPRLLFLFAAACLVSLGAWIALTTDWEAYGPAEPPEEAGQVDTSIVKLKSVTVGTIDALNQPVEFTWSQFQPIEVVSESVPGKVRPSTSGLSFEQRRAVKDKSATLCSPSIFVRIFRKSSLGDGSVRIFQIGSGASISKDGMLNWKGELLIPRVPGRYLVRVILMCSGSASNVSELPQYTIGTFYLDVIPEE